MCVDMRVDLPAPWWSWILHKRLNDLLLEGLVELLEVCRNFRLYIGSALRYIGIADGMSVAKLLVSIHSNSIRSTIGLLV